MNTHHQINYIEFQANDLGRIKTFYSTVFSWEFTDYGSEYLAFNDGGIEGGFAKSESTDRKSGSLVILYSEDLESSLAAIESNGGSITKQIFSFPGGRRFHFIDPAGNELAIWSDK